MNRREFLERSSFSATALVVGSGLSADLSRVPIGTIYSNDTTHILSCKCPWRDQKDPLTNADIAHSIKEAAGIDAHFLQPGLGWIPWWKSDIYSPEEHYVDFLQNEHGHKSMNKIGRYLLEGGDMLAQLVETCKEIGVSPFLSFRLNDGHHVRELEKALAEGKPSAGMSRHYWENYSKYRLGPDVKDWDQGVFDWSIPEVRDHKFALIEEACANYDLAGLELDFLRHWVRFGDKTPIEDRRKITTDFVRRIREMLDRTGTARGLPRRWLCIRVPAKAEVRPDQGVDLAALVAVGVDMINLSYSYFTHQDNSISHAKAEIGNDPIALYSEMTHCTMTGKATAGSGTQPFLRTTDEQFYTTARLALEQGARGVSLFNFPYYRYHVTDAIGPFHEPPFHVLPKLNDQQFLEKQAPWYFLSACRKDRMLGELPLPVIMNRETHVFEMEMSSHSTTGGSGLLRLRSDEAIADREIEVKFNGGILEKTAFVEKPINHPYVGTWLGTAHEHSCYTLPTNLLKNGSNRIEITVKKGIRVRLIFVDAVVTI